ncbi:MAG: tetratricopeptide repeat protein [Verrucomicrobia bacterium]|nr:tetratricopeptide repeat protein [Verrucomicrobiota bacterium]
MDYQAAFACYEAGEYAKASDIFAYLSSLQPMNPDHWQGLAASKQMEGKYFEALFGWSFTSLLSPEDPEAHFHAAECLASLGQKTDALKALELALQKTSDITLTNQISVLKEALLHG